jgi:hypothetical protein
LKFYSKIVVFQSLLPAQVCSLFSVGLAFSEQPFEQTLIIVSADSTPAALPGNV